MPILRPEPGVYPETLFSEQPELPGERTWRAVHTRPRQEKALARQLYQARLSFYLPLVPRRSLTRGRLLTSQVPLFPGYCFVLADERQRLQTLTTKRVVRILPVTDQGQLWDDLRRVHQLIDSGMPVTPEGPLGPGCQVEICTGPLAGLQGIIVRRANERRFVVQVDFIQRGASVVLDDFMIARMV